MFICDDESGATLSAMLDRRAVVVTASHQDSRQLVALELSAATIRGMIEELSAMADELDTEQIAAEVAAAAEVCGHEWRTAANHLTACAEPTGHTGDHTDATGRTSRLAVSYLHLKGYRVRRVFDTREGAQEFIDVNALICRLPAVRLEDIMRPGDELTPAAMAELQAAIHGNPWDAK